MVCNDMSDGSMQKTELENGFWVISDRISPVAKFQFFRHFFGEDLSEV